MLCQKVHKPTQDSTCKKKKNTAQQTPVLLTKNLGAWIFCHATLAEPTRLPNKMQPGNKHLG